MCFNKDSMVSQGFGTQKYVCEELITVYAKYLVYLNDLRTYIQYSLCTGPFPIL